MSDSGGNRAPGGSLGRLDALIREAGGTPPVHLWDPEYCGEMDLRIRRDGLWIHEGTPIGRPPLVKLFASVLKREGGKFFLVTPVEKLGIIVEDAPFIGVDIEVDGAGRNQQIMVETQLGDRAIIGPDHPLRVLHKDDELLPYVDIRAGLEARLDRKTLYRLAELAEPSPDGSEYGVWSSGAFFALDQAERVLA